MEGSVLPAYQESLKSMNPRAQKTLGRYTIVDGYIANSSPLMQIHLQNTGILPNGKRLATRNDLQTAIASDKSGELLIGKYTDYGVALRTARDNYKINDAIAKRLAEQLNKRKIVLGSGVLIPFSALADKDDANEFYGVTLDLTDSATKDTVRPLNEFKWDYTQDKGLACAVLDGRDWNSIDVNLGRSDGNGRVAQLARNKMKTIYQKIYSFDNLFLAYQKARKGKTKMKYVIDFEKDLERNLLDLKFEEKPALQTIAS